jgi:hypothetical protein
MRFLLSRRRTVPPAPVFVRVAPDCGCFHNHATTDAAKSAVRHELDAAVLRGNNDLARALLVRLEPCDAANREVNR